MPVREQTHETSARARDPVRPVVVGVDGSGSALDAVRWAARDAARLGVPVRLVHAYPRSDRDYPALSMNADQIRAELRAWGADRLRAAEAVARETAPGVTVELRLHEGDPRVVLRRESEHAASRVGQSFADEVEQGALAVGEAGQRPVVGGVRPQFGHQGRRGTRVEQGPAGADLAYGRHQVQPGDVLDGVAARAGEDGVEHGLLVGVGGQDEDVEPGDP